jgi:hypothetical protein
VVTIVKRYFNNTHVLIPLSISDFGIKPPVRYERLKMTRPQNIGTFCPCNGSLVTSPGKLLVDYELLHLQVACKVRVKLLNASFMCKECGCMHTCGSTVCHIMSRDSSSCVF